MSTSGRHNLPSGLSSQVQGTPPGQLALAPVGTASPGARLYADVDRNGKIDGNDDASRDQWSQSRGATFTFNDDDDDGDKKEDFKNNVVDKTEDQRTLARLVVGQLSSNPITVKLTYAPATAPVRVFRYDSGTGQLAEVIAPAQGSNGYLIPATQAVGGETNLFIESAGPRTTSWDGMVTFTLDVAGSAASQDKVMFACAPLILTDNTRPAVHVRAMVIPGTTGGGNDPFINALKTGLATQGVTFIPVDEQTYQGDRWVQDDYQIGYFGYVDNQGNYNSVEQYNRLERGRGLGNLVPGEILGKNKGHIYAGAGQQEGCNYGGNLEVVGPYTGFPFGRIYIGGGNAGSVTGQVYSRHMNQEQVDLMNAQGMQGPCVEISSEWLGVGHVDEMSMCVLDKNSANGRAWKILWASPNLAYQALTDLKNKGMGSAVVYAGRNGQQKQTTVDAILADAQLRQFNNQVQARMDSNKQVLMTQMGLVASDFIELPIYYEIMQGSTTDDGISQNPGSQNCIPINDKLYMPDPEGPDDAGKDVWQAMMDAAIAPLGLTATYVDVFTSYHELAGEAHCGSNTYYVPYTTPWWNR